MLAILCRIFQFFFGMAVKILPWRTPVIVDGAGSISRIPELLQKQKAAKPLIVTDNGLVKLGLAGKITEILDKAGIPYILFGDVEANPSVNTVNAIQQCYLKEGCAGFIALGGGSPMDAAKAAAARVVRPKKAVNKMGGLFQVLKRLPPFFAIPTTAGTGSETTLAALITDTDTHHKYAIMDLSIIPHFAILDPELTVGLPPSISAATGMDALTHAVEAYLCWTANTRQTIRYEYEAVQAIFENLEKVFADGKNIEARHAMLLASFKAGFAFTRSGVGNIHAIAHTLGGLYNTPHGLANAVILPIVLDDYGKKVHKKLARLADAAGLVQKGAVKTNAEKARIFIDAIYGMNKRMGIPLGFDFIKDDDIPQMTKWAAKESNPIYPVPVVYNRARYRSVIETVRANSKKSAVRQEGKMSYHITEACIGCTACVKSCPVFAISGEKNSLHSINEKRCVACGVCGMICMKSAVTDSAGKTCSPVKRADWPKPKINTKICSACQICVNDCTAGALRISLPQFQGDINVYAELYDSKRCVGCGICRQHCLIEAITMEAAV